MTRQPRPSNLPLPPARGVGTFSTRTTAADLAALRLGWYYNWRPFPRLRAACLPEFVPMIWGATDATPATLAKVARSGASHLLGFNEPDMPGQSNLSPADCLELWPALTRLPQRLGSPAPATAEWLDAFLPEARRRKLRVDFVCLHRYPDISNPSAVQEIESMLVGAHRRYGLPVWLTECGAADVSKWKQPQHARPTTAMAHDFLNRLVPMLASLPFVERHAWFADRVAAEYRPGTLFQPNGPKLTPLGRLYRAFP